MGSLGFGRRQDIGQDGESAEPDYEDEPNPQQEADRTLGSQAAPPEPGSVPRGTAAIRHLESAADEVEMELLRKAPALDSVDDFAKLVEAFLKVRDATDRSREATRQANYRAWDMRQKVWDRRNRVRGLLALGVVLGVFAIVAWGLVQGIPPSDLALYLSPVAGLAGLAVGYFFGQPPNAE